MNHNRPESVVVLPHDLSWISMYRQESKRILDALRPSQPIAHHIGSTAIPNCVAKPIVDILMGADDLSLVDSCNPMMQRIGYQIMGEYGISNRRYFRKNSDTGARLYHVHVFAKGDPSIERHLMFRDFLIHHPTWAEKYSDLKRKLATSHPNSSRHYTEAKTEFVMTIDKLASKWIETQN